VQFASLQWGRNGNGQSHCKCLIISGLSDEITRKVGC
jgi:hypothetical protein